ncbi:MAG: hypothetical protein KAT78_06440 [Flavobacteriaceae bacterium]|nr:hypothetical protein [Flavobacteriaceae bacterium]
MKKTSIITLLLSIVLISCGEIKKEDKIIEPTVNETKHEEEKIVNEETQINNDWIQTIKLNDSQKWEANIETTKGVNAMLNQINESNPNTVQDYLDLANKLNSEKNTLVKECTMTGPSHDNLHIFLHPLIEKINQLLKTTSTTEGSETTKSIKENLEAYADYFK